MVRVSNPVSDTAPTATELFPLRHMSCNTKTPPRRTRRRNTRRTWHGLPKRLNGRKGVRMLLPEFLLGSPASSSSCNHTPIFFDFFFAPFSCASTIPVPDIHNLGVVVVGRWHIRATCYQIWTCSMTDCLKVVEPLFCYCPVVVSLSDCLELVVWGKWQRVTIGWIVE